MCSFATKLASESWSMVPWVAVPTVPTIEFAVTVPLELILPEAVIWPVNVWVSLIASPNIFEPSVWIILEVTIEEVIEVTVKLVADIVPNVTLSLVLNPKSPFNSVNVLPLTCELPAKKEYHL